MKSKVLSCYRSILRTGNKVFKNDFETIQAFRTEVRSKFMANKEVQSQDEINELISFCKEVEGLLPKIVIQGQLNEKGRYVMQFKEEHLEDNATLKTS